MPRKRTEHKKEVIWNRNLQLPHQLRMIAFAVVVLLLVGTFGFMLTKSEPVEQAFHDTISSLAFVEINIPNAGSQMVRTFIAFLGVIVLWWAVWNVFDIAMEGRFSEYLRAMLMSNRIKKMKKHYIICGAGRVGEHMSMLFQQKRLPYILIDSNENKIRLLQDRGLAAICGDALDESVLVSAGLKDAKAVIAALPETEKNIMVSLIAREVSPKVKIYARAEHRDLMKRLKKAGADVVVMPEVAGAEELFSHIIGRAKAVSSVHV